VAVSGENEDSSGVRVRASEAWTEISADYDPLAPLLRSWFERTAATEGDELMERLLRCEGCLEVCVRTHLSWAKGHDTPALQRAKSCLDNWRLLLATARGGAAPQSIRNRLSDLEADTTAFLAAMPGRLALLEFDFEASHPLPSANSMAGGPGTRSLPPPTQNPLLREIDLPQLLREWSGEVLARTGRWVDLGSGDGRSLAALAALSSSAEVLGVDLAWSFSIDAANRLDSGAQELPPNAAYLLFGEGEGPRGLTLHKIKATARDRMYPDALGARIVATIGARSAALLTLLYPIHMPQTGRDRKTRPAHVYQLYTALNLLGPGGIGIVVTEDPRVWRTAVEVLLEQPVVESISYLPCAIAGEQLRTMGIIPYEATMGELDPSLNDPRDVCARAAAFPYGLLMMFRIRE
jgi:hypothetical protein